LAGQTVGGSSTNHNLGIGINRPQFGVEMDSVAAAKPPVPERNVRHPSDSLLFGDSAEVTPETKNLDPDSWIEKVGATGNSDGTGSSYFKSPAIGGGPDWWTTNPYRTVPRHAKRLNTTWFDGHAIVFKNSLVGYQYPEGHPNALWDLK
jgi:prepilin-type processing-associated H-X9-DG protein